MAPCWSAEPVAAEVRPAETVTMVLSVRVNTVEKGDVFVERTPDNDFLVKVHDLKAMGFRDPPGTPRIIEGEPYIALASFRGVSFEFNAQRLTLNMTADAGLLSGSNFAMKSQRRGRGAATEAPSAFFNYALTASGAESGGGNVGFSGELGWRLGDYLLLADGNMVRRADGGRKFVRLMTSVTRDDREKLQRTIIGDFFTPSRDFNTGVGLGGISVSKLYGLNPYFIQFPMHSVGGTVALPSDLEVFLDGQRIRTERLQPGTFELRDILAYGGARNVQLLLRDSFGRTQQLNYSFYFSDQALSKGLHEYSYNAGAMRRGYGVESNRYGPAAFTAFHRYGFSDAITAGMRAEGTRHLLNAGPLATVVLGNAGVVSMALAGSTIAGHDGASGLASYTYQTKTWSAGFSLRRDWGDYASLGDPPAVTNRKLEGSIYASYSLARGAISLSHSVLTTHTGVTPSVATSARPFHVATFQDRRVSTVSYGTPLFSGRATLTASVSHVREATTSRNEAFVGLIVFLEQNYSMAANYRAEKNTNSQSIQLSKSQPIGEGLGFSVDADRNANSTGEYVQYRSTLQYNAPAAMLRAELGRFRDQLGNSHSDYRLSIAGGVGYAQGHVAFGRPITGSFGIVKVGDLAGVGVSVNGQNMGKTNAQGVVFLPTLTPYYDNDVSIAPENIPIEYSFRTNVQSVSPSSRSGALLEFTLTRIQAFSGMLKYRQDGATKPVEFQEIRINAEGTRQSFQTGRGGEFYVENLKPGTYPATVQVEGTQCLFDIVIPKSDETFVELGELNCRLTP